MKQFFKFTLATILGSLIALVLAFVLIVGSISLIISSASEKKNTKVEDKSVLLLKLNEAINDRNHPNPFDSFDWSSMSPKEDIGLNSILQSIAKAENDSHIKGISLDLSVIPSGFATIEEIRNALAHFKKSGKFIYAYSEGYGQSAYYLASVADKIFLYPEGSVDFKGLKAEMMFYKGTLEKLEIEPEIIRHGKFKSAIEPFILEKMSTANREQIRAYVGALWAQYLSNVSASRGISTEELQRLADNLSGAEAQTAQNRKLVDQLMYRDEYLDLLKKSLQLKTDEKINFVSLSAYADAEDEGDKKAELAKDKIAIVYAEGEIIDGKSKGGSIGSITISEAIRKARLDNKVKAIVLRVNSPGGSALASDVMWREVILAKKVKPVVVSMGNVAASGGYYIACAAHKIFAQPNTITGSIGVFGLMFNAQKMLNNKLGITIDTLKTASHADLGSVFRPLTAAERDFLQMEVERTYNTFITHVSEGRKISKAQVDSLGQGRVWSGTDAKRLGLIDEFGGLNDAIASAATLAKISKYRLLELPRQKEPFEQILSSFKDDAKAYLLKDEFESEIKTYTKLKSVLQHKGIQTYMPFEIEVH